MLCSRCNIHYDIGQWAHLTRGFLKRCYGPIPRNTAIQLEKRNILIDKHNATKGPHGHHTFDHMSVHTDAVECTKCHRSWVVKTYHGRGTAGRTTAEGDSDASPLQNLFRSKCTSTGTTVAGKLCLSGRWVVVRRPAARK